eukprot:4263870-Karenia_brevis.AAC.1
MGEITTRDAHDAHGDGIPLHPPDMGSAWGPGGPSMGSAWGQGGPSMGSAWNQGGPSMGSAWGQ